MKFKNKKAFIAFSLFLLIILILIISILFCNKKEKSNIPVLKITLNNISLNEINNNSKEIKYKDNLLKIYNQNKLIFKDKITIKGRGNSTWQWPKKPYQITLSNDNNLLNLGKSNKFVLLANYIDETLIRNDLAFYIANKLNMKYTPKGTNIDLYINDIYQGVYYLTNKIDISEGSVNLKDDLGILVELDNVYYYQDDYLITNRYKDHIVLKDVKKENLKDEALNMFMNKYNQLEQAVKDHNWEKITSIADIESLAKHHLVYELTHNGDAYRSSFFMYMDGRDDLIHFGPVWDFDRAFDNDITNKIKGGNHQISDGYSDNLVDETFNKYSELMALLTQFDEFKSIIKEIWYKYMQNGLEDIENQIDNNYNILNKSATKNIKTWNYSNTYKEYIDELKERINLIYVSFNGTINNIY